MADQTAAAAAQTQMSAAGKKRAVTQSEGSAWKDDSSDDDGDAASLGPSPDDVCLSQTDNVTPAREKKRRRSSGAGVGGGPEALKNAKTIHDRVYGAVPVPGLLVAFLDTDEFQRLDSIGQLGGSKYVFPGAKHSRKEHSIGTSHMARAMVDHLRRLQPELGIDDADCLCVQLAALCHDIGHGPYSHMWEAFVHAATGSDDWTHEKMSARLIRRCADRNAIPLDRYFRCAAADAAAHLEFVCALIEGLPDAAPWPDDLGRGESKRFLFDIVSNSRSGMDVDKLDYLLRDGLSAFGASSSFDWNRLIQACRAVAPKGKTVRQIAFEEKVAIEINEIFALRARLHRQVYQHRVGNVAEAMITDALMAADRSAWRLAGGDRRPLKLSEAADDAAAFACLTDGILDAIPLLLDDGLEDARAVIARLKRRDFYTLVSGPRKLPTLPLCGGCTRETRFGDKFCAACGAACDDRAKVRIAKRRGIHVYVPALAHLKASDVKKELVGRCGGSVAADDVWVNVTSIKHGWKTTVPDQGRPGALVHWETYDPVANVLFFNPKADVVSGRNFSDAKISGLFIPKQTHERVLYCYFKGRDPDQLEALTRAYDAYAATLPGAAGHVGAGNPSPSPFRRKRPPLGDGPEPRDLGFGHGATIPELVGSDGRPRGGGWGLDDDDDAPGLLEPRLTAL